MTQSPATFAKALPDARPTPARAARTTRPGVRPLALTALVLAGTLLLGACDSVPVVGEYPDRGDQGGEGAPTYDSGEGKFADRKTVFGSGGLFNTDRTPQDGGGTSGIGVNSFLWRASLDTISFMPVTSADPFGGVIITDWHSPTGAGDERFKLNVYILGRTLRADGVRVSVFRQVRDAAAGWRDTQVSEGTASRLEDAILTRARQLRNETTAAR